MNKAIVDRMPVANFLLDIPPAILYYSCAEMPDTGQDGVEADDAHTTRNPLDTGVGRL